MLPKTSTQVLQHQSCHGQPSPQAGCISWLASNIKGMILPVFWQRQNLIISDQATTVKNVIQVSVCIHVSDCINKTALLKTWKCRVAYVLVSFGTEFLKSYKTQLSYTHLWTWMFMLQGMLHRWNTAL